MSKPEMPVEIPAILPTPPTPPTFAATVATEIMAYVGDELRDPDEQPEYFEGYPGDVKDRQYACLLDTVTGIVDASMSTELFNRLWLTIVDLHNVRVHWLEQAASGPKYKRPDARRQVEHLKWELQGVTQTITRLPHMLTAVQLIRLDNLARITENQPLVRLSQEG